MPLKKKPRPYCRKCGEFLIGGRGGYCPNNHNKTPQEIYNDSIKCLQAFPTSHTEYNKIKTFIEELIKKYGKEIKLK